MCARLFSGRGAKRRFVLLASALLLSGMVLCALAGGNGNQNPGVLPPNSNPYGMSYAEWGGKWWQWALSIPNATSPVFDTTGEYAAIGQSGPVWFLAGDFGGTVQRTVTVPAGKAVFFPIYNYVWVNMPDYGDNPWSEAQYEYVREFIEESIDSATLLACEIDGQPVGNIEAYRCVTPYAAAFMATLPDDNLWSAYGVPAGTYGPSVQGGYYLMLAPLPAGQHTIHIAAANSSPWSLDVTYDLTVKGGK